MMTRHLTSKRGAIAACALALSAAPAAFAQRSDATSSTGRPRSENERVVTESGTPSTINRQIQKDEAAAEGARPGQQAPAIPPGAVGSSSVPAPAPAPATGTPPGVAAPTPGSRANLPRTGEPLPGPGAQAPRPAMAGLPTNPGLDVAMLIEHALAMAIEATALQAVAEQASPDKAGGPPKELLDHARREIQESRELLTQAGADGRNVAAGSPTRRFYDSANAYITTLSTLAARTSPVSPADRAQVALVNHSIKEVLDANHLVLMGRMMGGSAAAEQLTQHARHMKDDGTQNVMRLAGNAAPTPPNQPNPTLLAQQGRALIEAADQLAAAAPPMTGMRGPGAPGDLPSGALVPNQVPGGLPINGENPNSPGRFQDPRPEIVGGTYSTGSPGAGTVNEAGVREALKETLPRTNPDPNPTLPNAATTVTPGGAVNPPANSRGGTNPR